MQARIILDNYIEATETGLVGETEGNVLYEKLLKDFDFKDVEFSCAKVVIVIPERILAMTKSFFRGCFKEILMRLGRDQFKNRYSFEASAYVKDHINKYIDNLRIGDET